MTRCSSAALPPSLRRSSPPRSSRSGIDEPRNEESGMSSERVVFWYGCNVVRHGDIIHYAIDLLRAAGIEPEPAGGPGYCCGNMKDADLQAAEGMAKRTVGKFNAFETDKVVTWCPSCHRHMNQFMGEYTEANFTVSHFVQILHRNRERLARAFVHPVSQRVLLHRHVGFHEVADLNELICDLLRVVPRLALVESQHLPPRPMFSAPGAGAAAPEGVSPRPCGGARAGPGGPA